MYETILFPTDGSDGADAALSHAKDLAEQYGATLHVLFVADDDFAPSGLVHKEHEDAETSEMAPGHSEEEPSGMVNKEHELGELEKGGQQIVSDVVESVGGDIPTETVVVSGNPYERILDYAEESDADLIVMGTHGRTGVDRYLLGSVTEKVVRTSDVPVLTVRMDA